MSVDERLLRLLRCPVDKAAVHADGASIVCSECGRRYPVRDAIPVMLQAEAEGGPDG